MKKKILIIILILLIIATLAITSIKLINSNNKEKPKVEQKIETKLTNIKEINLCKENSTECFDNSIEYGILEINYNKKEIEEWLNKINKETENYYQESLNSIINDNDEECNNEENQYKYKLSTNTQYNTYINEKYISISIRRIKSNLCTTDKETTPIEILIYDLEKQKTITQEEFKSDLKITDNQVKEAIENNIEKINNTTGNNLSIENTYKDGILEYQLYYFQDGSIMASYYDYSENSYYTVVIQ